MGLRFIIGRAGTGKTTLCMEEIIAQQNTGNKRQILIVDNDRLRCRSAFVLPRRQIFLLVAADQVMNLCIHVAVVRLMLNTDSTDLADPLSAITQLCVGNAKGVEESSQEVILSVVR